MYQAKVNSLLNIDKRIQIRYREDSEGDSRDKAEVQRAEEARADRQIKRKDPATNLISLITPIKITHQKSRFPCPPVPLGNSVFLLRIFCHLGRLILPGGPSVIVSICFVQSA